MDTFEVDVVKCALQLKSPQWALGWVNSTSVVLGAKAIAMSDMGTEVIKEGKFVQDIIRSPCTSMILILCLSGSKLAGPLLA